MFRAFRISIVGALLLCSLPAQRAVAQSFFLDLGDLPGGQVYCPTEDLSDDGTTVVGQSSSADGYQAYRWTEATGMVGLGDLPGGTFFSFATAVSADGSVVVGYSSSALTANEAFLWTEATGMVGLGLFQPGHYATTAWKVSPDGSVIVGWTQGKFKAIMWDEVNGWRLVADFLRSNGVSPSGSLTHCFGATINNGYITLTGRDQRSNTTRGWIAQAHWP